MTYALHEVVLMRREIGTVSQVYAHGFAYKVTLANGQVITCAPSVLQKAPENVTIFRLGEMRPESSNTGDAA